MHEDLTPLAGDKFNEVYNEREKKKKKMNKKEIIKKKDVYQVIY